MPKPIHIPPFPKLFIPPLLLKRGEQILRIKAFVDREIFSGVGMISDGGLAC